MSSSATLTTSNLPRFRAMIDAWEAAQPPPRGFTSLPLGLSPPPLPDTPRSQTPSQLESAFSSLSLSHGSGRDGKDVLVAFRTRPPLEGEAAEKFTADPNFVIKDASNISEGNREGTTEVSEELEVEFCPGISVRSAEPGVMVAHVPGMKWNGPTITQKSFEADFAFGPDIGNDEVYARTVGATDMLSLALGGGVGCVLAYGQTGSGKTYTMEALEQRIARDIFPAAEALSRRFLASQGTGLTSTLPNTQAGSGETDEGKKDGNIFELSVSFLELLGRRASDLVDDPVGEDVEGNAVRTEVAVQENKLGEVRPRLIQTVVRSVEELQSLIVGSLAHRRTSATRRNATSSRSHAVLTIRVKNTLLPYADDGLLILVDLAGSERYEDSKAHDKQRMDESRENNRALMNLKECVRAKAKAVVEEEGFVHIPFRSNKLTLLLKPLFDLESRQLSKTIVIAHVSPHIQDAAHGVSTLAYAAPFKTAPPRRAAQPPYDAKDPRTWDHTQTARWLTKAFEAKARGSSLSVDVARLLPPPMTAKNLARMYANEWVEACLAARTTGGGEGTEKETEALRNVAAEVYGQFNYLLLTARVRTRKEVIKSRKTIAEDEIYGEAPPLGEATQQRDVDGWIAKVRALDEKDIFMLYVLHNKEITTQINDVIKKARAGYGDIESEKARVTVELVEKYKDEIVREKAKKFETNE